MKAKIMIQYFNFDSVINALLALIGKYHTKEIVLSYIPVDSPDYKLLDDDSKEKIADFLDRIKQLSAENIKDPLYKELSYANLEAKVEGSNYADILKGYDIIDVSTIQKVTAIDIAAAAVSIKGIKVCNLVWKVKFEKNQKWILTKDNHEYKNLMNSKALSELYKDYFKKKYAIQVALIVGGAIILLWLSKYIFPEAVLSDDFINVLSLSIGAGGLYLSYRSINV